MRLFFIAGGIAGIAFTTAVAWEASHQPHLDGLWWWYIWTAWLGTLLPAFAVGGMLGRMSAQEALQGLFFCIDVIDEGWNNKGPWQPRDKPRKPPRGGQ